MTDPSIMLELAAAVEAGQPVVLATVVATRRSVPRRPGAKMLVFGDGTISGTVGGGEMEHRVKLEAATALSDGKPRLIAYALVTRPRATPACVAAKPTSTWSPSCLNLSCL